MPWERTGQCCRCGECCNGDPFPTEEHRLGDSRFSETWRRQPEREGKCPLLTFKSGSAACIGHGTDAYYLSGCNVWPTDPRQVAHCPSCTYEFEWVDGD